MIPNLHSLAAYGKRTHHDTCVVERDADGPPVFNPATNSYDDPGTTVLYSGNGSAIPTGGDRVVDHGGGPQAVRTYDVMLDGPVPGIAPGDRVRWTTSRDPKIVGMVMTVLDVVGSSLVGNRRLACEERMTR